MTSFFKTATAFRTSLETRLKNHSKESNQDLQRLRRIVAFDRFLARVFHETDVPQFFLKGGYAMELQFQKARATRDIDLTYSAPERNSSNDLFFLLLDISRIELHDFFRFQIERSQLQLENAPYGGTRFLVTSFVDGRQFVRFHLDVGCDIIVSRVERIRGSRFLDFCDIVAPEFVKISTFQQFAEKIHAYSLPREGRVNSRVKDLVDLFLIQNERIFDLEEGYQSLQAIFASRKSHSIPTQLRPPPEEWKLPFAKLGNQCGINISLDEAYTQIHNLFLRIVQ